MQCVVIMTALWNRAGHYIFFRVISSYLTIYLLFSSPNLSGRKLDVYHTSTHGVALVRISNAGLKPKLTARGSLKYCRTRKNRHFWHHSTTLSGSIFGTKACIDNWKNLLDSNTSSTCPDNMVNFGLLTAEICWRVWGTPANFNGFRVLAALLHGTVVVGVSQTLQRWTEGATYIRQGGHGVGHWPTF